MANDPAHIGVLAPVVSARVQLNDVDGYKVANLLTNLDGLHGGALRMNRCAASLGPSR